MRAKALQILAALVLVLGFIASPSLDRSGYQLDDCNGSSGSGSCGGG